MWPTHAWWSQGWPKNPLHRERTNAVCLFTLNAIILPHAEGLWGLVINCPVVVAQWQKCCNQGVITKQLNGNNTPSISNYTTETRLGGMHHYCEFFVHPLVEVVVSLFVSMRATCLFHIHIHSTVHNTVLCPKPHFKLCITLQENKHSLWALILTTKCYAQGLK